MPAWPVSCKGNWSGPAWNMPIRVATLITLADGLNKVGFHLARHGALYLMAVNP